MEGVAMFKRRKPVNAIEAVRQFFWPRMGWLRVFQYYRHRIFRTDDSLYRITAGLASGATVSFSPLVGTHLVQAVLLSRILKANWIAAVAGTLWGNPWTFPFLFAASYGCGARIMALAGLDRSGYVLPPHVDMTLLTEKPLAFLHYLAGHPMEIFLPMMIGSVLAGTVFWFIAYGMLYYPVKAAAAAYARKHLISRTLRRKK